MRFAGVTTMLLTLILATSADAATIGLKVGDYGTTGLACHRQPNATTMSFDGRSFSYPHASKCTDKILMRSAGVLTIAETCRAAGDGSPVKANTETFKVHRRAADRFTLIKGNIAMTYRWCGSVGYFNKH